MQCLLLKQRLCVSHLHTGVYQSLSHSDAALSYTRTNGKKMKKYLGRRIYMFLDDILVINFEFPSYCIVGRACLLGDIMKVLRFVALLCDQIILNASHRHYQTCLIFLTPLAT